jgi:hypothetical protein
MELRVWSVTRQGGCSLKKEVEIMKWRVLINTVLLGFVLAGPTVASATNLTCNDLVLLRVILRQDLAQDAYAARVQGDELRKDRAAPLELTDVEQLQTILADAASDEYKKFNAARKLAYLGDHAGVDILSRTLAGEFAMTSSEMEKSQAGLCLLWLQYDLPEDFAFSRLANPLYPELDALLPKPSQPAEPNVPYSEEEVTSIIEEFIGLGRSVEVRGPLSMAEVEREALVDILCGIAEYHDMRSIPRLPFGYINGAWEELKGEVGPGDFIYFFTSDQESWQALYGIEGYALIRDGEVIGVIVTAMS